MDRQAEILAAMAAEAYTPVPEARATKAPSAPKKAAVPARTSWGQEAFRAVVGGVRDAVQGTANTVDDLDTEIDAWARGRGLPGTYTLMGRQASNGIFEFTSKDKAKAATKDALGGDTLFEVEDNQSAAGKVSRDLVEFGTSFIGASRALKGVAALGTAARMSAPVAAGAAAAFVDIDPMEGNLANLAKELGVPANVLTEALSVEEDDGAIEARLKNAAADAVTGVAFDAAFKAMAVGIRQVRGLRGARDEMTRQAAVPADALRHAPELEADAVSALTPPAPKAAAEATGLADPKITKELEPGAQADLFGDLATATKPAQVDELEQALFNIPSNMRGLPEADLLALAKSYHEGTGYEVLKRLGLNPARIDFAKVIGEGDAGVDKVAEMVERIAEAVQPIANEAGSKPRSWTQTSMLANLIGTSEGNVVVAFKGASNMLDAKAWAARQMLGGSAARLTTLAEQARAFIDAPTSQEYIEFLKALEAHAALQAQFKAATSNLGRALNSLKGTATAKNAVDRARRLNSLVPGATREKQFGTGINTAEGALRALGDAKTPKERQRLIEKIIKHKGDTAALTKIADQSQGPARWQRAVREYVTGNLFSVGTASVNILSTAGHIGFRALARLPVQGLAYATGKAGGRDYVAARVAETAYFNSIVPAFGKGFGRVMRLVSDDLLEEFQGVAGSFGDNAAERGLGRLRTFFNDEWGSFQPRFERADAVRAKEWRVSKETVEALMDNTDQLPALMRMGLRGIVGVGTGAFNVVGSTARVIRLATIDVTDELFGTVSLQATRAAEATRIAALEGFDRGLQGAELAKYARQRADVLLSNSSSEMMDRIERLVALGAKEDSEEVANLAAEAARVLDIEDLAETEARKVLFQDDLDWKLSQSAAKFLPNLDGHTGFIFPFIRTPLKILETTLGDYTPLGLLQQETRERIMSGGIDAQIAVSQMALGTMTIASAVALAAGGYVVGHDGGTRSSTRMERPSYSMKVGDKWVEFSRFDPFGMLLGLGADIHEKVIEQDGEDGEPLPWEFERAVAGMLLAINRNILSKTWMTSARDIVALASAQSDAEQAAARDRVVTSSVQKTIPAGGMVRWWEGTDDNVLREANTLWERVMTSTFAADELPVRRDGLLGRPVQYDRILGIQAGSDEKDPVIRELSDLSFDLPPNTRTFRGVELNSKQLSRLKELRGQVVTDDTGLTMEAQVRELVTGPEWREMDRSRKVKTLRSMRDRYHDIAIRALRDEDREFDHAVGSTKLQKRLEREGYTQPEISAELQRFKEEVLGN
jgi:hypothetical protein